MKAKRKTKASELDMSRYDWSKATRGRFAGRLKPGKLRAPVAVRILDDELVDAFPDSASVNAALRSILAAAKHLKAAKGRSKPAA
jgi:hypothetical protein